MFFTCLVVMFGLLGLVVHGERVTVACLRVPADLPKYRLQANEGNENAACKACMW